MYRVTKRFLHIFVRSLFCVLIFGVFTAAKAEAAEKGQLTMEEGSVLDGIYYSPIYIDGDISYCLESSKDSPVEAWYDLNEELLYPQQSLLAKAMYYAYGGPGYQADFWVPDCLQDVQRAYLRSHMVLSMIYNEAETLDREVHDDSKVSWWRAYIAGRIQAIKDLPVPPGASLSFSKSKLTGEADANKSMKRTEEVKINGAKENSITILLPAGVTLVNISQGKNMQDKAMVSGGESFYLQTEMSQFQGEKWTSDILKGSVQNDYLTCVVSTGAGLQTIGKMMIVQPVNTVRLEVDWKAYGKVKIQKKSLDEKATEDGVDDEFYSLEGAVFVLKDLKTGQEVESLHTDKSGKAISQWQPLGSYVLCEQKSPPGYLKAEEVEINLNQAEISYTLSEEVQHGKIRIQKVDAETLKTTPQAPAEIKGAEYEIRNSKGELLELLVTGDDGLALSEELPLGQYTVLETKASKGYTKDEQKYEVTLTSKDRETAVFIEEITSAEQIIRGDIDLTKVSNGDMKRLAGVPFRITNKLTKESQMVVTDENGYASTEATWNPHERQKDENVAYDDGLWFGEGEPDDSKGALPYGTYIIEELSCKANETYTLIPAFEISILRHQYTVKLGTLINDALDIPKAKEDKPKKISKGAAAAPRTGDEGMKIYFAGIAGMIMVLFLCRRVRKW